MTTQELHTALHISTKIRRLEAQQEDIRQSLGKAPEVRVQGGRGVSVAQIAADLAEEIAELRHELEIEKTIIQRCIDKCGYDNTEHKLMTLHYVKCYPWHMVFKALGYAHAQGFRIRNEALKKMILNDI